MRDRVTITRLPGETTRTVRVQNLAPSTVAVLMRHDGEYDERKDTPVRAYASVRSARRAADTLNRLLVVGASAHDRERARKLDPDATLDAMYDVAEGLPLVGGRSGSFRMAPRPK